MADNPQPPQRPKVPLQSDIKEVKSAQSLLTVAAIGAPVSLLFGGILLSCVAGVCALLAFAKIKRVTDNPDSPYHANARQMKRQVLIAMAVSAVALVLNSVAFSSALPDLINAVQSGDLESYLKVDGGGTSASSGGSGSGSSAWG